MAGDLPTGTVTMLFSDLEGSTTLLSRLGPLYVEVLSGQREVLREAWVAHGGIEMGTEGDSFFVVFATASAAIEAAVQAQRGLLARQWPDNSSVLVRMGIHTGSPTVHDGGYVGMDVHRAARIAAAAHGGQVFVSAATAHLIGDVLRDGTQLRELGFHQLKDIPAAEQLFQLTADGMASISLPPRTLGSVGSLPQATTALVGRDGELAELTALLRDRRNRLLSLTGPGGTGKTRLAIGIAEQVAGDLSEQVVFVPLASVSTSELMWAAIADALELPAESRMVSDILSSVTHQRVLFVLDNLEQIAGADVVVDTLLREAREVVVIATSRRALHLAAEQEHPVPPLEVPASQADVATCERYGAIQLFIQQARRVKPSFSLTADNVSDVTAVCRRLDGLPLAIELAAARIKLLSPHALLSRLDEALDLRLAGVDRPTRQHTLRAAIGWSYELLALDRRAFFRCLGVFAGGADLEAVEAVTGHLSGAADVLEVVAELVDLSLVTIGETLDGEPRIALLETIRAYARDELIASAELHEVCRVHAEHYLAKSEKLEPAVFGRDRRSAMQWFQNEQENLRAALEWALTPSSVPNDDGYRNRIGLRLCSSAYIFWETSGHSNESLQWFERAIRSSGERDSRELAVVLRLAANLFTDKREYESAHRYATMSIAIMREQGAMDVLPGALCTLAQLEDERGEWYASRRAYEEALTLGRAVVGDDVASQRQLRRILGNFASSANTNGELERSLDLGHEAIEFARRSGDVYMTLGLQQNLACTLHLMGRLDEAERQMRDLIPGFLDFHEVESLITVAEDYASVLSDLGFSASAVRLFTAAEATRERIQSQMRESQEAQIGNSIVAAQIALEPAALEAALSAGRSSTIEDALSFACRERDEAH